MFKTPQNWLDNSARLIDLYFIECGEFTKVGLAADTPRRLIELQLGNPYPLRCAYRRAVPGQYARQVEKLVHQQLAHVAIGREWFRIAPKAALEAALPIIQTAKNTSRRRAPVQGTGLGTGMGSAAPTRAKHFDNVRFLR